jgi:hypothetical protein
MKPACASKGISCINSTRPYKRSKIPLHIDSDIDIISSQLRPTRNMHMLMVYTSPSGMSFNANQIPDPINMMKFFNASGIFEIKCIVFIITVNAVSTVNNRNP